MLGGSGEDGGWTIHFRACSSAEGQEQPVLQVTSLNMDGVREMGQYWVITNSLKASVHLFLFLIFFFLFRCMLASL